LRGRVLTRSHKLHRAALGKHKKGHSCELLNTYWVLRFIQPPSHGWGIFSLHLMGPSTSWDPKPDETLALDSNFCPFLLRIGLYTRRCIVTSLFLSNWRLKYTQSPSGFSSILSEFHYMWLNFYSWLKF
jgi:hypothetical protein